MLWLVSIASTMFLGPVAALEYQGRRRGSYALHRAPPCAGREYQMPVAWSP